MCGLNGLWRTGGGAEERYVALLRGINVGKAKRVAMADLRAALESLGYTDVATLLNSGNAVFTAPPAAAGRAAADIQAAVLARTGVSSRVTVLDAEELGLGALDPEVVEHVEHMAFGTLLRVYSDKLADSRGHPLTVRRYMWKMDY